MNHNLAQLRTGLTGALLSSVLASIPAAALAADAIPSASPGGIHWQVTVPNEGAWLRVKTPDGTVSEQHFPSGVAPWFASQKGGALPDGLYRYEVVIVPVVSPTLRASALSARERGERVSLPSGSRESGIFRVTDGVPALPDDSVVEPRAPGKAGKTSAPTAHKSVLLKDFVIADDLIVDGSACIGFDCVNGESFGFDTLRLKENNLRIKFDDTSTAASFPRNDWQLTANDSANGGASKFSIDDITGARTPFTIEANARSNSLYVDDGGRLGLRTSTPSVELHMIDGDTPTVRLQQDTSSGFAQQTWDMAGNETNFFVRDVTNGSQLPFRIRPGAPSSSIFVDVDGRVGLGTSSPNASAKLHLRKTGVNDNTLLYISNGTREWSFGINGASDFFRITDQTAGASRLAILNNGNVGIGTTAPTLALSVTGDANKSVGGGSWQVFSDERLKNIKGSFNSGLEAVMRLQPIRYEYKSDNALGLRPELEQIGFGAEALRKIIPEAVTRNENGYLMVNNDPILWTMLNAIKEQTKEIASLRGQSKEIASLKRQVKRLQAIVRKRQP